MPGSEPLVPAHAEPDFAFYLAVRFQHPCPQCRRTCVMTHNGVLCDISEETVPTPIFAQGGPADLPASKPVDMKAVRVLLVHRCDPEDLNAAEPDPEEVAQHSAIAADLTEAEAALSVEHERLREQYRHSADEQRRLISEYGRRQALTEKVALERACPKCPAQPGQPCLNLIALRKGEQVPTRHPHPMRITAADAVSAEELLASLDGNEQRRRKQAEAERAEARQKDIEIAKAQIATAYRSITAARHTLRRLEALGSD